MTTTLKTLMTRLKLKRTAAAAAAAVVARAPSPQANERRMAKETGGNGCVYTRDEKEKHFLFNFIARRRCTAGPMYYYSFFVSCKICGAFSRNERGPSRSMFHISHTPPISGSKLKYSMDSS